MTEKQFLGVTYDEKKASLRFIIFSSFTHSLSLECFFVNFNNSILQAKEGGRGVKTVYKGIKSKIKEAKVPGNFRNSMFTETEIRISSAPSSPENARKSFDDADASSSNENLGGNGPLSLSPSPVASRSSSGMNILQELEREGLFHRPEINRSVSIYQFLIIFLPLLIFVANFL